MDIHFFLNGQRILSPHIETKTLQFMAPNLYPSSCSGKMRYRYRNHGHSFFSMRLMYHPEPDSEKAGGRIAA